ncbi:Glycosyl transferase family 1 [Sphingomonas sp. EC-HK361]|uniref:glycosyltransferase n=1 Tax=Sphingomonas sp. EC-HK361 TaxID=2038397 RepID=UPI001252439F|nr:glycosyltransferase [Sphingomonas sp. EC-HK361]VVT03715.1 Glycosyl transferase family 1 [Sphingomonas sp. EC-HK361]
MLYDDGTRRAEDGRPLILCDLTQSWSPTGGGGISTYLKEKRRWVLENTSHHLLQIVPGPEDRVTIDGRHIFAEVGADPVRGSPNYRFILRTSIVRELLATYRPDVIESLCPWVLPWTAINHRKAFPDTALVAGYRTDFPNAHVYRVGRDLFGDAIARGFRWLSYGYAEITYREFDHVYTLGEPARRALAMRGIDRTSVLPLGTDTALFSPRIGDPHYRRSLGLGGDGPLLIYAGRIDNEKRADRLVAMFRRLPADFGAAMVMIGDGKLRDELMREAADLPIAFPGFERNRAELAKALASSDIYVSAMADETFGISIIEAQAAGLPVVGVASGAMPDRVPQGLGYLGPVDDVAAMAANVERIWCGDHRAMSVVARQHVIDNFGWNRTFRTLLEEVYPAAMRAAQRRGERADRVRAGRREIRTIASNPPC